MFLSRPPSRKNSFDSTESSDAPTELLRTRTLEYVHLKFNLEAAFTAVGIEVRHVNGSYRTILYNLRNKKLSELLIV